MRFGRTPSESKILLAALILTPTVFLGLPAPLTIFGSNAGTGAGATDHFLSHLFARCEKAKVWQLRQWHVMCSDLKRICQAQRWTVCVWRGDSLFYVD